MQGSQAERTASQRKHTAKNIMALRGSERLRGWAKGEWIGKDASHRKKVDRQTERKRAKDKTESQRIGEAREKHGRDGVACV